MADNKEPLANLAKNYPPGSRGLGVLILREYAQIESARQRGWCWKDIAEGMNLPGAKAKALAEAFRRVARRIAAGRLVAPKGATSTPATRPAPRPAQAFDINSIPRIGERK